MDQQIESLRTEATAAINAAKSPQEIEALRVQYLGKKGSVSELRRSIGAFPKEDRPAVGKLITDLLTEVTELIDTRTATIQASAQSAAFEAERIDVTLPGRRVQMGKAHPITQTADRIREIFRGLGFEEVVGPEVETEWHNFDALNTPAHHPARDSHDTFYFTDTTLLRTHTSPVQVRTMLEREPPLRVIVPGRAYRRDADVTHSPMFHQCEGLLVDENVRFSDLKGILAAFAREMFGADTKVRFRPHYFPFTEPSAEVDISCVFCEGEGCRVCKQSGWLEVLGAGAVDPQVFKEVGYDPERYTGFAFGMGIDRIAMLNYRINDIRLLFENDMRFLTQF
ncbi:MAG: phenylalanine--tRNA ligase subunit alpha [Candidatus Poribacteria bacterium]|nr:phenylalanine--tRNA ligase subunit alpha [Candidatus Poribacteria bacterium]